MSDPIRLRFLKALTAALQEITPANGYHTDLSTSVFRGRLYFSENDPVPMVSILEAVEQEQPRFTDQPVNSGLSNDRWELLIQGFAEDDPVNPTDPAHYLMADVKKRLGAAKKVRSNILGMGPRLDDMRIGAGVVRPPDDISNKCYFWLKLSVRLVEDLADPYAV